jgi:hypothetical protein
MKQSLITFFSSTTPPLSIPTSLPQKIISNEKDNPKKEPVSFDLRESISNLQRILYIENLEDWYQIPKSYILAFGGKVLAKKYLEDNSKQTKEGKWKKSNTRGTSDRCEP